MTLQSVWKNIPEISLLWLNWPKSGVRHPVRFILIWSKMGSRISFILFRKGLTACLKISDCRTIHGLAPFLRWVLNSAWSDLQMNWSICLINAKRLTFQSWEISSKRSRTMSLQSGHWNELSGSEWVTGWCAGFNMKRSTMTRRAAFHRLPQLMWGMADLLIGRAIPFTGETDARN